GKFDEAEAIAKTMQPLRDIAFKWLRSRWVNEKLIPITYMKAWSELLGMAGGPVRTPLINITDQERATLKAEIEKTGLLARVAAAATVYWDSTRSPRVPPLPPASVINQLPLSCHCHFIEDIPTCPLYNTSVNCPT
ncbi:MAG: hypothetical protein EBY17_30795, partial [Acidobacteriia bacterium]|nr:hypothetical protein [Terriglobia bacterium]